MDMKIGCAGAGAGKMGQVQIFNINGLPLEIMRKIYNYIPQKQVPALCLVSRTWKDQIYNLYRLKTLVIDETQPNRNMDLDRSRPCNNLVIKNLTSPLAQFQQSGGENGFLKYPLFVKELIFRNPVEPELMQNIICSALRLESLMLESSKHFDLAWTLSPEGSIGLGKLKELQYLIIIQDILDDPDPEEVEEIVEPTGPTPNSVPLVPLNFYFPKLKYLNLDRISGMESGASAIQIKKIIARHAQTLTLLAVREQYHVDPQTPLPYAPVMLDPLEPSELASLNSSQNLTTLAVGTFWKDYWPIILKNQTKLEVLVFQYYSTVANRDGSFGIPWTDFRHPIINSSATITRVVLSGISPEICALRPLDLNIFHACTQLKRLEIQCTVFWANGLLMQPVNPLMINGQHLPPTLEALSFLNITMLSIELVRIIQTCKNLCTLNLSYVGNSGTLGVNSQALFEMKNLPLLQELAIKHLNVGQPGDLEYQMMDNIFGVLGQEFEGSYSRIMFRTNAHAKLQNRLSFLAAV